ncbi:unnamed protein product [Lymnaea stagnalis]|uniref:Cadherin domain-containing protein n=1 Tax=Lymnaea stagnalis TaxID=6523 RepID=A0AAV2HQR3_LYMST
MATPSLHRWGLPCGRLPSSAVMIWATVLIVFQAALLVVAQPVKIRKTIKEELVRGSVIASLNNEPDFLKVLESLNDTKETRSSPTGSILQYNILASGNPYSKHFTVNKDTGVVSILEKIDREDVCSFRDDCQLSFEVAAKSLYTEFFSLVDFTIVVTDINDNPPQFKQAQFELNMPENVEVDRSFQLPTAFDKDTGPGNGVTEYVILKGEPFFNIRTVETISNRTDVYLHLVSSVNRELSPTYKLLVGAKDGGIPSLTGTLTVEVHISDINDNFPVFEQSLYLQNIPEDTRRDHILLRVTATDADTGPNGELTYTFSPLQPQDDLSFFRIDPSTGDIYLTKPIDSRSGQKIELIVEASDKGHPPKTSWTTVKIQVEDTVNSMPEIIIDTLSDTKGISEVSEFADIGKVVAHVSVRDPDSGNNGQTECKIHPNVFDIVPLEDFRKYKAVIKSPLDREVRDKYNVTVSCSDGGIPSLLAKDYFIVKVLDENDQAPKFSQRVYQATLLENNSPGAFITQLNVTDNDIGINAEFFYQVVGSHEQTFSVDGTGRMTANIPLDREEAGKIVVTIRATDKAVSPLSSSATVEITLLDVNDERPVFSQSVYTMEVEEENPPGKYVGIVSASDKDLGANGSIIYMLHPSTQREGMFSVSLDGGVIKTNAVLDRERKDGYDLMVFAVDKGNPSLTGSTFVIIKVTDINDNEPYFLYPVDGNNTLPIPHTFQKHDVIVDIKAKDMDAGVNGQISYSLNTINKSAPFTINRVTGAITLEENLLQKDTGLYIMTIVASDQAKEQQKATQTLLYIDVYFDNSTLITAAGTAGPSEEVLIAIIIVILVLVIAAAVFFIIFCIRRRKLQMKNGVPNSASTSSTVKLHGGYYVSPGVRESSSSFIAKQDEGTSNLGEGLRTSNPYVVLMPKLDPAGPAEVISISRNGNAHGLNDTLNTADLDQTDDGQFSTFKSQDILSQGGKNSSLKRQQNDSSSIVKRVNETFDDMSGDDSTSDSGRGGSDLDVNKEKARAQAATPVSVKSGISHRLSPLPREHGQTFLTFRGDSPSSFRFDSDSDTLTRNNPRQRAGPVPMISSPVRREIFSNPNSLFGRQSESDTDTDSIPRNRIPFQPQPYSTAGIHSPYINSTGYGGASDMSAFSRQPHRITPFSLLSPPATCHQYDTETDQSDGGSNPNSLTRRNHVPRLPIYPGIEFTHNAYGAPSRNSIGAFSSNSIGSHMDSVPPDYGRFSANNAISGLNYEGIGYPNNTLRMTGPDSHVTSGFGNVVSELQTSRPVSMEEEFLLPPYPVVNDEEEEEEVEENNERLSLHTGYTSLTPDRTEEQTVLFDRARYESSA